MTQMVCSIVTIVLEVSFGIRLDYAVFDKKFRLPMCGENRSFVTFGPNNQATLKEKEHTLCVATYNY